MTISGTRSTEEAARFVEGMTIGDHFVIRGKLGGGGMGEVYLAENLNIAVICYAVKVLRREFSSSPRFVEMLRDEAQKQARLKHENVVGIYDYFVWDEHHCLVQEFVEGATLEAILEAQPGGMNLDLAIELMVGILGGLDFAHKEGILHCDVKPANVIVGTNGRPRVTDFGISRDIRSRDTTGLGGAGTAEYMSPEQTRPPYQIDHRSDVFAAGVTFFEMLCCRRPFKPCTGDEPFPQRTTDAPDVRSIRADIPQPVARIVATALQRDPDQRFQSCGEFVQALLDYRRGVEIRRLLRWAIPVMLVALAATVIGLHAWREHVSADARAREGEAAAQIEQNQVAAQVLAEKRQATIEQSVHNASVALEQLCQLSAEYEVKKDGVEVARRSGLDNLARLFTEKLGAMQREIEHEAAAYRDAVSKLSSEDPTLVGNGIERARQADPLVKAFGPGIAEDDRALRSGRALPALEQMKKRCPATVAR